MQNSKEHEGLARAVPKLLEMSIYCSRVVATTEVTAAQPGRLSSETNDNSVAILLSYGTARILLTSDAEAREEEYMAGGPYTRS